VIFKPFTVSGTDTVFSVTPIKVRDSHSNKITIYGINMIISYLLSTPSSSCMIFLNKQGKFGPKQEYITIIKNGCMLAEVIPCSKDQFSGRVKAILLLYKY